MIIFIIENMYFLFGPENNWFLSYEYETKDR